MKSINGINIEESNEIEIKLRHHLKWRWRMQKYREGERKRENGGWRTNRNS
jgi:hypothetical protein